MVRMEYTCDICGQKHYKDNLPGLPDGWRSYRFTQPDGEGITKHFCPMCVEELKIFFKD